jgi:hypothetical protein
LVSCVINIDERFQPSMTSTGIGVLFSTKDIVALDPCP